MNQRTLAFVYLRDARPNSPSLHANLEMLNDGALAAISRAGWTPVFAAASDVGVERTREIARSADAVLLMGGEDVHPSFYGGALEYPDSGLHEPIADEAHIHVVRDALTDGRPLLGICRGQQIINVALGGDLIQHLDVSADHRVEPGNTRGEAVGEFVYHPVYLTDAGARVLGAPGIVRGGEPVLSSHHQAIGRLGQGLVATATAHDGVVEAIAHVSAPIFGVQWHPEHPVTARDQLTRLLTLLG